MNASIEKKKQNIDFEEGNRRSWAKLESLFFMPNIKYSICWISWRAKFQNEREEEIYDMNLILIETAWREHWELGE